MNTLLQRFELNKRNCCLFVMIIGGLCAAAAQAQTPSLSAPPPLPSLSGLPSLTPATPNAPSASATATPSPPALPPIPMANSLRSPNSPVIATEKPADAPLTPLADLPASIPGPEGDNVAQTAPTTPAPITPPANPTVGEGDTALASPTAMPNLATPLPPVADTPIAPPTASIAPPTPTLALPPVKVADTKPKVKTWETKLAPTVFPPKMDFNYRRQVLPPTISATRYDRNNQHLPLAVTREDYAGLLFLSVRNNDVESARTILNAGNYLNAVNTAGETPLIVANRVGAKNVAALLVARGARL